MERWQKKIAVVTGASSGIGAATAKALVEKGMIVVGLARRLEKMATLVRSSIAAEHQKNFHPFKCDVSDEQNVKDAFAWIEKTFGGIDVLVNNAGVMKPCNIISQNNSDAMKDTVSTNILGIVWCTREAFRSMKKRNFDGHVVLINSVAGHQVPNIPDFSLNIYAATKHAVTAMTEVLRQEFSASETKIKVTSISPGAVHTEIMGPDFEVPKGLPILTSENIADAVVYCIQTPPNVQVHEMIIRPVGEKF